MLTLVHNLVFVTFVYMQSKSIDIINTRVKIKRCTSHHLQANRVLLNALQTSFWFFPKEHSGNMMLSVALLWSGWGLVETFHFYNLQLSSFLSSWLTGVEPYVVLCFRVCCQRCFSAHRSYKECLFELPVSSNQSDRSALTSLRAAARWMFFFPHHPV